MSKKERVWRLAAKAIWLILTVILITTIYANNHYPHGTTIHTGEFSCNDNGGGCAEDTKEDTRNLNIPQWAKFVKDNTNMAILAFFVLGIAGLAMSNDEVRNNYLNDKK